MQISKGICTAFLFSQMPFSERAKTIALAIVKIFETSKPFGDYSAVAVLDDGAGISYGVNQFTHRSGSLWAVLSRFVEIGGDPPKVVLNALPDFSNKTDILGRSNDKQLRNALKDLGTDPLMQRAQREIAFENYLRPALEACEGSDFVLPLSLAVIYDSMNHGSYDKIRDRVQVNVPGNGSMKPEEFEKEWITAYVWERHAWLSSVARLKKTNYRTSFFKQQIEKDNWDLDLPLIVHGYRLTEQIVFPNSAAAQPSDHKQPVKPVNSADKQSTSVLETTASTEQPPNTNGQEVKIEVTPDGGTKIETSNAATTPKERIAVVRKPPEKWFSRVWAKITAAVSGNVVFQWIWAQIEKIQTLSIPDAVWIIVSVTIAVGSLLWIVHEIVATWRSNKYQEAIDNLLVKENSTPNNLVQLIPHDEVELYRARGFKIITRGEPLASATT